MSDRFKIAVLRKACEIRCRDTGKPWVDADFLYEANRMALRKTNDEESFLNLAERIMAIAEDSVFGPPTLKWFNLGYGAPGTHRDGRQVEEK